MRTRLSVTLYVNCTSCYLYLTYKHPSTSVLGSGILLSTSYGHCCTGNGSITSHGTATHKAILSSTILNLGSKLRWTASCPGHLPPPPPITRWIRGKFRRIYGKCDSQHVPLTWCCSLWLKTQLKYTYKLLTYCHFQFRIC